MNGSNNLPDNSYKRVQWTTFLVYFLLTFLAFVTGWGQVSAARLQDKFDQVVSTYVLKEQYYIDRTEIARKLDRLEMKIDQLIKDSMAKNSIYDFRGK